VIKGVRVLCTNDDRSCSACIKLDGISYDLDRVPELPNPQCTNPDGCRCTYISETRGWDELLTKR
jgi:hypothetical protein